jgi:hypothetical protein
MKLPNDLVKSLEESLDDGPVEVTLGCGCHCQNCDAETTEDTCFECGEEVTSVSGEVKRLTDAVTDYFQKEITNG